MIHLSTRFVVLVSWALFSSVQALGQTSTQKPPAILIKEFLYSIYQTNQDPLEIAKKYIGLDLGPNDFSIDERYRGVAGHIADIREKARKPSGEWETPILFNPTIDKILPYRTVQDRVQIALPATSGEADKVYVLFEHKKPRQYFFVSDNKIVSFFYFEKGAGAGYFLTY